MKDNLIIKGKRIYLRLINKNDISQKWCDWINNNEINRYLETKHITIEKLNEYAENKIKDDAVLFFGIFLNESSEHIGNIKLESIDLKNKKAIEGILIGEKKCWNKGFAPEAIMLLNDYAFDKLDLEEIYIGINEGSKESLDLHKRLGFEIYKIDKKALRHNGKYYDNILMRIKKHR